MAFTYSKTTPDSSDTSKVRFLVGDIDYNNEQLSDEEIAYLLSVYPDVNLAAAHACRAIIARLSADSNDRSHLGLSSQISQRIANYESLATRLEAQAGLQMTAPFVGGVSSTAIESLESDTDLLGTRFSRDGDTKTRKG